MDKILKASELLNRHCAEVSTEPGEPLSLNSERYLGIDAVGGLITLGLFSVRKLVGYSVNIVGRHMNYDLVVCANSLFYVAPEYRGKGYGAELMDETRREARSRGCDRMMWSGYPGTPFVRTLQALIPEHSTTFSENLHEVK